MKYKVWREIEVDETELTKEELICIAELKIENEKMMERDNLVGKTELEIRNIIKK